MDHPMPMGHEFGSLTPEPNFMIQPGSCGSGGGSNGSNSGVGGGPGGIGNSGIGGAVGLGNGIGGGVPEHLLNGPRGGGGSPEFMNSGNFSDSQSMQTEGLVW